MPAHWKAAGLALALLLAAMPQASQAGVAEQKQQEKWGCWRDPRAAC